MSSAKVGGRRLAEPVAGLSAAGMHAWWAPMAVDSNCSLKILQNLTELLSSAGAAADGVVQVVELLRNMNLVLSVVLSLGSVFWKHSTFGLGSTMKSFGIKQSMSGASRLLLLWTCWWCPAGSIDAR